MSTLSKFHGEARAWTRYLGQGTTWIPASGQPVAIRDMDPSWRLNAARWLLRRAGVLALRENYAILRMLDGAQVPDDVDASAFEEFDRRMGDPAAWLRTTPLYRALVADLPEADR